MTNDMPRTSPRRITKHKLLKFTGQQSDSKQILSKLDRHERMVRKLEQGGWHYDPVNGTLSRGITPESSAAGDASPSA